MKVKYTLFYIFLGLLIFPMWSFAQYAGDFLQFVVPFKVNQNAVSLRVATTTSFLNGELSAPWLTSSSTGSIYYNLGKVGIGTSSPLATLQVLGQVSVGTSSPFDSNTGIQYYRQDNGFAHIMARSINSGSGSRAAVLAHSNAAQVQFIAHGSGITTSRWGVTLGGYGEINGFAPTFGLIVGMVNDVPVIFGNNSLERMRINSGGNIGINDTTPDSKLDVGGRISSDDDIYVNNSASGIILKSPDGTCARGVISDLDVLSFTSVSCPF